MSHDAENARIVKQGIARVLAGLLAADLPTPPQPGPTDRTDPHFSGCGAREADTNGRAR